MIKVGFIIEMLYLGALNINFLPILIKQRETDKRMKSSAITSVTT